MSENEKVTGADALIKALEELGVEVIFGYPGGANLPIYESLYKSKIKHVLSRHEQGAALMANGYARQSLKVGVCLATSGPGVTNLVTGIADGMQDSVPMVVLTGQIPTKFIGTDAFQEVDCINLTMPITKHNELITDVNEIVPALKSAFHIAHTGRKGPVLLDIPRDVMQTKCDYDFSVEREVKGYNPTIEGHLGQIKRICRLLSEAKRPIILAGGGIWNSGAVKEFTELVNTTGIPVVRTLMGKGLLPEDNPHYIGMIGTHGNEEGNKAVFKADVILAIGARFGDRSTLQKKEKFCPDADIIHIDIDPAEISKIIKPKIPLVGDIKIVLAQLLKQHKKNPFHFEQPWFTSKSDKNHLYKEDAANVIEAICRHISMIDQELILTTDVGRHQMWATHCCDNPKHMPILTSGGLGTMGFGLPAAIGAWFADPKKPVVNITGDGSFWMNLQEIPVAVEHNVPLTIAIVNDSRLGMIRELQHQQYSKKYIANELPNTTDYIKLAESMGAFGILVTTFDDILPALKKAINSKKVTIIDFDIFSIEKSMALKLKKSA